MLDRMLPSQLLPVGNLLPKILHENVRSLFISVNVSQLLFDGIQFCTNTTKIVAIMCSIIKKQNLQTVKIRHDGSMQFSLFGHVSLAPPYHTLLLPKDDCFD